MSDARSRWQGLSAEKRRQAEEACLGVAQAVGLDRYVELVSRQPAARTAVADLHPEAAYWLGLLTGAVSGQLGLMTGIYDAPLAQGLVREFARAERERQA